MCTFFQFDVCTQGILHAVLRKIETSTSGVNTTVSELQGELRTLKTKFAESTEAAENKSEEDTKLLRKLENLPPCRRVNSPAFAKCYIAMQRGGALIGAWPGMVHVCVYVMVVVGVGLGGTCQKAPNTLRINLHMGSMGVVFFYCQVLAIPMQN